MPEKRYKKGCGNGCIRCWVNNLKHGNKEATAYLKKHPELELEWVSQGKKCSQRRKAEESEVRRKIRKKELTREERISETKRGNMDKVRKLCEEEKKLQEELDNEEWMRLLWTC